jgi:uncharacterized protein (TIGR00369 family)
VPNFEPANPDYAKALEQIIYGMPIARFLGLRFTHIAPGLVELEMPFREELAFTEGAFQAGPIGTLLDFTAGSAVGTLLPRDWGTSTIDFTVKVLAPARGEKFLGRGAVVSWGKSLSVGEAKIFAVAGSRETLCATGLVTMRNFPLK